MKKTFVLLCLICLLCSCATTGKTESADAEAADEKPAKKSTLYRDVDNAVKANCFLNPIACLFSIPFRVIDAVEFIGDAVKDNALKEVESKEGKK
jgi:hypothetical protein